MLFGIFMVGPVHNVVHIASGIAALVCAGAVRKYFQIFGIVYALVAVIGFFYGNTPLLGMMEHNVADIVLHVSIAVVALYLGFTARNNDLAPDHRHWKRRSPPNSLLRRALLKRRVVDPSLVPEIRHAPCWFVRSRAVRAALT